LRRVFERGDSKGKRFGVEVRARVVLAGLDVGEILTTAELGDRLWPEAEAARLRSGISFSGCF
jgi:hypothetical protein